MRYLSFLLVILFFVACKPTSKYADLDLMGNGLPIKIKAPDDAVVKVKEIGGLFKDVTVKSDDNFYIQITSSDALDKDRLKRKNGLLEDIKGTSSFTKIVEDNDEGFIFEKKLGDKVSFDFRSVRIQGDKEYIFQTGLLGTFSEEQVRDMYEAVK